MRSPWFHSRIGQSASHSFGVNVSPEIVKQTNVKMMPLKFKQSFSFFSFFDFENLKI